MIHRIGSDLSSFKEISFRGGLNILVAEKTQNANDRQTRNRAGKSSLVDLVHFLLGGSAGTSIARNAALVDATFEMDLDVAEWTLHVERSGASPSKPVVQSSDPTFWTRITDLEPPLGTLSIANTQWRSALGQTMFGLPPAEEKEPNSPTFRMLFPYFCRPLSDQGVTDPKQYRRQQKAWQWQVAISYLLGLDWTIPQRLEALREEIGQLDAVSDELTTTSGRWTTAAATAEKRLRELRETLGEFRVFEGYREYEREAAELSRQMAELSDANTSDRELLAYLEDSVTTEEAPDTSDVESLFWQAGIDLPESVVKRLDEVRAFHQSVVANRRSYLTSEISSAAARIADRDVRIAELDGRRAEIMRVLRSTHALDDFIEFQSRLGQAEADLREAESRLNEAREIELRRAEAEIQKGRLHIRLQQDIEEKRTLIRQEIAVFEEFSERLYEKPGSLEIEPTQNGPNVDVTIEGHRSRGIANMKVFCFDMMLMHQWCQGMYGASGPGFLIHDSHLFDGVDGRQVAAALRSGAEAAEQLRFQYIVTMNSDDLARAELPDEFIAEHKLEVTLTDASEDGGLFGFRFA